MRPTGFDRESFVPVCTSFHFVCTSTVPEVQRFSIFDITRYYCISAIFQDIEMRPTGFNRELFVPACTSLHFVCTSTGPEVANFARFDNTLLLYLGHFSRYRNAANGVR